MKLLSSNIQYALSSLLHNFLFLLAPLPKTPTFTTFAYIPDTVSQKGGWLGATSCTEDQPVPISWPLLDIRAKAHQLFLSDQS